MPELNSALERQKKSILVVDDDQTVRMMMIRVLNGDGYMAFPAAGGQEALKLAAANVFDLVLLDLEMPETDGWKTFHELVRRHPRLSVIIITARPNQHVIAEAAGAEALFEKPLAFPELLRAIQHLLAESPNLQN